jgi:hypothetical protein
LLRGRCTGWGGCQPGSAAVHEPSPLEIAEPAPSRPLLAALYGLYYDEQTTPHDARRVVRYNVYAAAKSETIYIPVGLFCDDGYADISAVISSSLATWGKVRALADNPSARTVYTTFHPSAEGLRPEVRTAPKSTYTEHLLDGTYVLHNPFARHPLPTGVFSHPRVAELRVASDGELVMEAPSDFLLTRMLTSFHKHT